MTIRRESITDSVICFTSGFEVTKTCFPTDYRAIVDENPATCGKHVQFWGIRHIKARIYETVEFKHDELLKVTEEDTP